MEVALHLFKAHICVWNDKSNQYLQELASHSPLGLNLTDDTAFVCPANVNLRA